MTVRTQHPPQARQRPQAGPLHGRGSLPTRARVRSQVLVGALLIVGTALVGGLIFLNAGDRVSALAVREEVPVGQKITRENLVSTSVAGVSGAILVEDVDRVVGKTAAVGLVEGQILTDAAVSDEQVPTSGQALTGLALTAAQMPGDGLESGDQVRLIAVPGPDAATGESLTAAADVLASTALVYAVRDAISGEAAKIVTVVVPAASADRIAVASAAGRVALVKTPNLSGGQ